VIFPEGEETDKSQRVRSTDHDIRATVLSSLPLDNKTATPPKKKRFSAPVLYPLSYEGVGPKV